MNTTAWRIATIGLAIVAAQALMDSAAPRSAAGASVAPSTRPDALPAAASAATAPDVPAASDPEFAPLLTLCKKIGQRQWGQPIVETFEDEKAADKDAWKCQGGKMDRKDGKLLVKADANQVVMVSRRLPAELKDSQGLRIEAWVQVKPMAMPAAAAMKGMFRNYQNVMFVSPEPLQAYQWDYQYLFAQGQNGAGYGFNSNPWGYGRGSTGAEIKAGKLVHVTLELVGQHYRVSRDDDPPFNDTIPSAPAFKVAAKTAIGFASRSAEFAIVQLACRGLTVNKDALTADDWKPTAFADQQALTCRLADRVVPRLIDPRYPTREAASNLLAALWPLSKPAVDAAAGSGPVAQSAEGQLRLKALGELVTAIKVSKDDHEQAVKAPAAKDLPVDEDDKPRPAADDTTQPDRPRMIIKHLPQFPAPAVRIEN